MNYISWMFMLVAHTVPATQGRIRQRKIHPVYRIGIAGMIVAALRIPFSASETWIGFARWIVEALA